MSDSTWNSHDDHSTFEAEGFLNQDASTIEYTLAPGASEVEENADGGDEAQSRRLGFTFRRRKKGLAEQSVADGEATPSTVPSENSEPIDDFDAPESGVKRRGPWISRQTRIGIAAVASFLILAGVLIANKAGVLGKSDNLEETAQAGKEAKGADQDLKAGENQSAANEAGKPPRTPPIARINADSGSPTDKKPKEGAEPSSRSSEVAGAPTPKPEAPITKTPEPEQPAAAENVAKSANEQASPEAKDALTALNDPPIDLPDDDSEKGATPKPLPSEKEASSLAAAGTEEALPSKPTDAPKSTEEVASASPAPSPVVDLPAHKPETSELPAPDPVTPPSDPSAANVAAPEAPKPVESPTSTVGEMLTSQTEKPDSSSVIQAKVADPPASEPAKSEQPPSPAVTAPTSADPAPVLEKQPEPSSPSLSASVPTETPSPSALNPVSEPTSEPAPASAAATTAPATPEPASAAATTAPATSEPSSAPVSSEPAPSPAAPATASPEPAPASGAPAPGTSEPASAPMPSPEPTPSSAPTASPSAEPVQVPAPTKPASSEPAAAPTVASPSGSTALPASAPSAISNEPAGTPLKPVDSPTPTFNPTESAGEPPLPSSSAKVPESPANPTAIKIPTIGRNRMIDVDDRRSPEPKVNKDDPIYVDVTPSRSSRVKGVASEPASGTLTTVEGDTEPPTSMATPHTVQRGENLWTISRLYYGYGWYYKALWAANKETVAAVDKLYVGQVIRIPPPEDLDRAYVESARKEFEADRKARSLASSNSATSGTSTGTTPVNVSLRKASRSTDLDSGAGRLGTGELKVSLPTVDPLDRNQSDVVATPDDDDEEPAEPVQKRGPRYKIRPYETLRSIARDTLGDSRRSNEIYELNQTVIDDPAHLITGQIIELPADARIGRVARKR